MVPLLAVLRVVNVLPQVQVTWVSPYAGWMSLFMTRSSRGRRVAIGDDVNRNQVVQCAIVVSVPAPIAAQEIGRCSRHGATAVASVLFLLGVRTDGHWDPWIRFFADGLTASAKDTDQQLRDLLSARSELKAKVRAAGLRADNAMPLVDYPLECPIFSVRQVQRHLGVTYSRANGLV